MIEALLVFAVLCGCAGAWKGSRAAIALLASTALTSGFVWAGVPFNIVAWLLIDLVVIAAIVSRKPTVADMLILALFIPAWAFYVKPDAFANYATTLIVSAQLLLTFPAQSVGQISRRLVARWKANFQHRDEWTDLERRGQREANA